MAAPSNPGESGPTGPVPEDNQPGHHPEREQDQPDLDAFARRLSIIPDTVEPTDDATGEWRRPLPDGVGLLQQVAAVRRVGRLGLMLGVAAVVRVADAVADGGRTVLTLLDEAAVREVEAFELHEVGPHETGLSELDLRD
ncbi:MAG: hypothetical protein ACK4V6_13455 [Microthrixaceae bacterium]